MYCHLCYHPLYKGKPNWCTYSDYLNKKLNIPKNINTVLAADKMTEHFIEVVTNDAQVYLDTSPPNQIQDNQGALPLFILKLIQQKHYARRAWQNQRHPVAKKNVEQAY
ncbi:unnamed protein product [Macrosiphum euphorbiae]|uniref:Uncharacterized protein n=1 Tax=Macrosiphum euphorbiae TaxID=13131 RepID=A0AAV0VZN5_9HEMI|nr:unnamed protein product [Macrosiphum euphorbiae]